MLELLETLDERLEDDDSETSELELEDLEDDDFLELDFLDDFLELDFFFSELELDFLDDFLELTTICVPLSLFPFCAETQAQTVVPITANKITTKIETKTLLPRSRFLLATRDKLPSSSRSLSKLFSQGRSGLVSF
jgi:hypothetical protein